VIVEQVIAGEVLGLPLQSPWGLAAGTDDNVYCVDRGNNRIIKFSRALQPIRDAGGAGSEAGLLSRPGYAAVDNQLNVWVADEGNQRISRFNSDLLFVDATEFYNADDPLQFGEPGGVAVSAHGELWAGDRQRNRIAVFTNTGAFDRFVGDFGYAGGQVREPQGIRADGAGRYYVCDGGNGRVVVYDRYGTMVRTIAHDAWARPKAAAPAGGGLWVLDGAGRVYFCDARGGILFAAGPMLPGSDSPLREPSDLAVLADGRLLIADTGNNRLLVCRVISDAG